MSPSLISFLSVHLILPLITNKVVRPKQRKISHFVLLGFTFLANKQLAKE